MEIVQVAGEPLIEAFHELPLEIYRNDPNWVCPLKMMIEDIFNPQKNAGFVHGNAQRWLVKDGNRFLAELLHFTIEVNWKKVKKLPEILVFLSVLIISKPPICCSMLHATG